MRIRAKRLELPSRNEFLRFVEEIRTARARQFKDCANLVRFLGYSGLRLDKTGFVTWADSNFSRHQLHVRGDPITATKNGEMRYVPMTPELEQMLTELHKECPDDSQNSTVMRVFECQNSMTHAALPLSWFSEVAAAPNAEQAASHEALGRLATFHAEPGDTGIDPEKIGGLLN